MAALFFSRLLGPRIGHMHLFLPALLRVPKHPRYLSYERDLPGAPSGVW